MDLADKRLRIGKEKLIETDLHPHEAVMTITMMKETF